MAKKKTKTAETDSTYLLKMLLYLIIGSFWLRITNTDQTMQIPIPVGLIVGIIFASHEHFQIDRKLEYAILLLAMFIGFWLPIGVTIVR
jgi:hypothetical protein